MILRILKFGPVKEWPSWDLEILKMLLKVFDNALKLEPNFVWALDNMCMAMLLSERYEESLDCFNKALEINPTDEILLNNKAFLLSSMGKFEDAVAIFDMILDQTENRTSVIKEKSNCLLNLERYAEALECILEILEVETDDPDIFFKEGNVTWRSWKIRRGPRIILIKL